ncbi:hypothetical protein ACOACO_17435 [Nocardioides sp. CPCC 205120]|uniref:hypothetical protein n=1 Tax=Nocardioides sp. CPCC 205120 TaxID=3406462 RepID=UPI003B50144F
MSEHEQPGEGLSVPRATSYAPDVPAASDTPLEAVRGRLRDRRAKAADGLQLDLPVPRLEPPIYVRYRPVSNREIKEVNARYAKSKDKDREVLVNASLLARACLGIFEEVEGELVSPLDGGPDFPKFDEAMAAELGSNSTVATEVVRALFLTDGDIISQATQVAQWSGYADEQIEREGN